MAAKKSFSVFVNARLITHQAEDSDRLLTLLHDQGLCASKLGCGTGHCGACTVWVADSSVRACDFTLGRLASTDDASITKVTTLEGFADTEPLLAKCLIDAFLCEQAAQCGYCTSGILMKAALLIRNLAMETRTHALATLDEAQVAQALDEHLCRCGSHRRVMRAVMLASENYSRPMLVDLASMLPTPAK